MVRLRASWFVYVTEIERKRGTEKEGSKEKTTTTGCGSPSIVFPCPDGRTSIILPYFLPPSLPCLFFSLDELGVRIRPSLPLVITMMMMLLLLLLLLT